MIATLDMELQITLFGERSLTADSGADKNASGVMGFLLLFVLFSWR